MRIDFIPAGRPLIAGHRRIAGRVSYRKGGWRPETLWFDLPADFAGRPGDGWLAALLPLAFQLGEPLEIGADVDSVLLANAARSQELWTRWYPSRRPVPIEVAGAVRHPLGPDGRTALLFSGGIDSFYTLFDFDARAGAADTAPIEDLIYVWGYDLSLSNRRGFVRKSRSLAMVAERLGKGLLTVATNLRQTRLDAISWPLIMHGPALAAPVLMLAPSYALALLSASGPRPDSEPYGTHPIGDPLMSTSATTFQHYGIAPTRLAKTALVAQSDVALAHLHVCWRGASDRNCGRCIKCCLTQMALELVGRRHAALTFDPRHYSLDVVRSMRPNSPGGYSFMAELQVEAERIGHRKIAEATAQFRRFNGGGAWPPPRSWWSKTALKWGNSVRKRQLSLARLVRSWQS